MLYNPNKVSVGDLARGIKPCPFCGEAGVYVDEGDWQTKWVQCTSCGAEGGWVETTDEEAIAKWNRRV